MARRKKDKVEKVDHPVHYGGDVTHEVYKCAEFHGLHTCAYLFMVFKYIARNGKKPGEDELDDLKKARWYLNRKIALLEGK